MSKLKFFRATAVASIALSVFCASASAVVVDGIFDPNEGYTNVQPLAFQLQNGSMVQDPGTLAWTTDAAGNVYVAFVQPLSINDNTYGTNAIGWGHQGHKFDDLTGSDKAQFNFTNGAGQTFIYTLDYISQTNSNPRGYASLGVTGGDGSVGHDDFNSVPHGTTVHGAASDVLAFGTSLSYDFNHLGFNQFTTNSPATTATLNPDGSINYAHGYANPASAPGWVYNIEYEVEIAASAFGPSGFAGVTVPAAHDSPSKVGQNTIPVCPDCIPVPEAGTYVAGLFAIGIALANRRKLRSVTRGAV